MARVLTALSYYAPYISGLTEFARLAAEHLAASGHDVTVVTTRHEAGLAARETLRGVKVVRADPLLRLHKGIISIDFIREFRKAAAAAGIVHLHLPLLESGLLAGLVPRQTPLVITYHCDVTRSAHGGLVDRLAVAAVRRSCRVACLAARRITVSSADYASGSPVVSDLAAKWVEAPPPDKAPRGAPLRADREDGQFRIGFLGRFTEEKGVPVLLEAFREIIEAVPMARLVLGGNYQTVAGGSEFRRLEALIRSLGDRVELLGQIPEQRLFDFYRSLDLFVLPSINSYEAFGMVQVEAMKVGVPVVASDLRGVRVPVQRTGNGSLATPGSPADLARAIVALYRSRENFVPATVARRAWQAFPRDAILKAFEELMAAK